MSERTGCDVEGKVAIGTGGTGGDLADSSRVAAVRQMMQAVA